ncbi:hypothetical protein BS17DRAFT_779367 [Gyrodon lividus]|nr:hypothetical protein BS17DRAFT_779367 [Gyrodon lividus]
MNSGAFSFYSNAFGFVAGGISPIGLVFGLYIGLRATREIQGLHPRALGGWLIFSVRCLVTHANSQLKRTNKPSTCGARLFAGLSLAIENACSQVNVVVSDKVLTIRPVGEDMNQ